MSALKNFYKNINANLQWKHKIILFYADNNILHFEHVFINVEEIIEIN